jgi:hypothetical protein
MRRIFTTMLMLCALVPMASAQDAIQSKIDALSATLGSPVGEERTAAGDGLVLEYQNGTIYSSPATGVYVVSGAVLTKYNELGAEGGKLGYPVGSLQTTASGTSQIFEHGLITVSRTAADPQAEILEGVSIAEGSLTVTNPGILAIDNDGTLIVRQGDANFVNLNCTCIEDPDPTPPIGSERLGLCSVKFSKDNKRATCFNSGGCKGTCRVTT